MGRSNNYVTLKLTHLPPIMTLCHVCSREPSCVMSLSAQKIHPLPIENGILGFKKERSRSKEISFVFHMFFFSTSTSNTKRVISLKSKNIIIVIRLPKLVLYHLRQWFHFHEQFLSFLFPCFYLRMNLRFKLRECFEIFSHIFPYWRTFYNSYLSVFTHESFLISIN